jgi:hypothetical protein
LAHLSQEQQQIWKLESGCGPFFACEEKTCLAFFENITGNFRQLWVCFAGSGGVFRPKL